MAEGKMKAGLAQDALEGRIVLALESRPEPEVPASFAARVVQRLPSRRTVALTPRQNGQRAAAACLLILLALMMTIAHRASGTSIYWFSLQSIFCAQFALLCVWLARSYRSVKLF